MFRRVLTAFLVISALLVVYHCEPTSPDPKPRPKRTASSKKKPRKKYWNKNRPGGHRKTPLPFAIAPGKPGERSERPYGVWQRIKGDLRILQDPAPNEGAAPPETKGKLIFSDDFERAKLGPNWRVGGGRYYIKDGTLFSDQAYNENVFLTKPLPRNVRIEFDTWSESNRVDIKCSVFDDGIEHESGYVILMGGWYNSVDMICRGREHDHEAVVRTHTPFEEGGRWKPNKKYHWTIIRQGSKLYWYVDNKLYLVYDDPKPLYGPKNRYFSFSNWKSRVHFDNLRIYELPEGE